MKIVPLGELIKTAKGKKPVGVQESPSPTHHRLIQIEDLRGDSKLQFAMPQTHDVLVETRDLVLAWDGANAGTLSFGLEGAIGSTLARLRIEPNAPVDTAYLGHFLRSKQKDLRQHCTGATIPHIHAGFLNGIEVPLPSLDEQRRIAAILDKTHQFQVEEARLIKDLSHLRRSLYSDFVQSHPYPESPLSEFATFYSGGTPSRKEDANWGGDFPWYTPKDFKKLDISVSIDSVTQRVRDAKKLRELPCGTVAVVVRGMILAHTFPVCVLNSPGFINQDVKALVPRKQFDHQFLADSLRDKSDWVLSRVSSSAHGTRKLDLAVLSSVPIPDVPYEFQREYAKHISKLNLIIKRREKSAHLTDELFKAIQALAFRGEL